VMIGWVLFRADTLPGALGVLTAMSGLAQPQPTIYDVTWYLTPELLVAMTAGVIAATPIAPAIARRLREGGETDGARLAWAPSAVVATGLFALLAASVMLSAARTYNPFIYFRF
jgi:alginate O-acetyltransferase complex protein AlgI